LKKPSVSRRTKVSSGVLQVGSRLCTIKEVLKKKGNRRVLSQEASSISGHLVIIGVEAEGEAGHDNRRGILGNLPTETAERVTDETTDHTQFPLSKEKRSKKSISECPKETETAWKENRPRYEN